jgi:hypothetical protein
MPPVPLSPAISAWLAHAVADAEARDLPGLAPLLESLARSLQALRDADGEFGHPAVARPTLRTEAPPDDA